MGRFDGKVVFITGAARGIGRSHAVRFAGEGADIVALDLCAPIASAQHTLGTADDLAETVAAVEKLGRRIVARQGDVRNFEDVQRAVDEGLETLGHIDVLLPNAGIFAFGLLHELTEEEWRDTVDVSLTGAWHVLKAAVPAMINRGTGGAIVMTSSTAGTKGFAGVANYVAAKHGIIGLAKSAALELAQHQIRVNTVGPAVTATEMALNDAMYRLYAPDVENPTIEDAKAGFFAQHLLPIPWLEVDDISNAVLFLASDEARYITGVHLPVDAGTVIK